MHTTALDTKVDDLFDYVQERCLWQFFSRTWDRQENIDGILKKVTEILSGQEPDRASATDKVHYADATTIVRDFRERFPWIREAGEDERRQLMDGLRSRLEEITITKSKNRELNHHLY